MNYTSKSKASIYSLQSVTNNKQNIFNLFFLLLSLIQRLTSLVDEMGELVSAECQRQGAWGLLGEGTGALLLCPDTGTVLTKEHIFGESNTPELDYLNIPETLSLNLRETAPSTDKNVHCNNKTK